VTPEEAIAGDGGRSQAAIDVAMGIVLAGLAALSLVWLIPTYVGGTADAGDVAPSFFPNLAAWVILVLSLGMVAHRLMRARPGNGWPTAKALIAETLCSLAALVFIGMALPHLGYLITSGVVIMLGGLIARYQKWWMLVLVAVLFPLIVKFAAWRIFVVELP